jgi:hypothetical protein
MTHTLSDITGVFLDQLIERAKITGPYVAVKFSPSLLPERSLVGGALAVIFAAGASRIEIDAFLPSGTLYAQGFDPFAPPVVCSDEEDQPQ